MATSPNDDMKLFADNLWEYFRPMLAERLEHNIGWFRAVVTANPGNGMLTIQRPFDTPFTVKCTSSMSGASVGDNVLVFSFGENLGTNAIVVGTADGANIGGGGEVPLPVAKGGTGATDANNAHWNLQRACYIRDGTEDYASYAWHKIASFTTSSAYYDSEITFLVTSEYSTFNEYGILNCRFRTSATAGTISSVGATWSENTAGIKPSNFVIRYTNGSPSCTVEIWAKLNDRYQKYVFTVLSESNRNANANVRLWTLYNSNGHGSASYATGSGGAVSVGALAYTVITSW